MKRSPLRVLELCVYILLIICAIIFAMTGKKPQIFDSMQTTTQSGINIITEPPTSPPKINVPKSEVFPDNYKNYKNGEL